MPELKFDLTDPHILRLSKRVLFIDIETSLLEARVFRTGLQQVNANQLKTKTRVLTAAGGTLHDLLTEGEEGMWSCSNHRSSTFKKDPMDDAEILADIWEELDAAEVVVAHNAAFDQGWLFGRFLELGWTLPSKFFLFCTYRNLTPFNLTSKKLDSLAESLVGTKKIETTLNLWMRCFDGDKSAFEEMEAYNLGDVYNTLFKVWMRTAYYNPHKAIDFSNPKLPNPTCKVDGSPLVVHDTYRNKRNGLDYLTFLNPRANILYIDRYNTGSKKAGRYVRPHLGY